MAKKKPKEIDPNCIFLDKEVQNKFNQLHQTHKLFLVHYFMDRSNATAAYRIAFPTASDQVAWNKSRLLAAKYAEEFTAVYDKQNIKARQFTLERRTEILASIAEDVTNSQKDRINALVALAKMEGLIKTDNGGQEHITINLMSKAGYDPNAIPADSIVKTSQG